MSNQETILLDYEGKLQKLQHWPSKPVIYDLTSFANRNSQTGIAGEIADILISRIIDVCEEYSLFIHCCQNLTIDIP